VPKAKKSLGRDAFETRSKARTSGSLKKLITGKGIKTQTEPKEVEVRVKLSLSNIKHLDNLIAQLEKRQKKRFTRNELIRIAITLLSAEDF
jgi:hypothetical protein